MKRPSAYTYDVDDPPGVNIHRLRNKRDWSQRNLADKCHPPLNHTTVHRLEHNKSFTHDCLKRVAIALDVTVLELFRMKRSRARGQ